MSDDQETIAEQQRQLEEQKKQCIFCQIIRREKESKIVYEDDKIIAMLDAFPMKKGHLLVMPKEHYMMAPMIPAEVFSHLFKRVKDISTCLKKSMVNFGYTMFIANGGVAGQQVYHFMLHLIPGDKPEEIFNLPGKRVTNADIEKSFSGLKKNLNMMMANQYKRMNKEVPQKVIEVIGEGKQGEVRHEGGQQLTEDQIIQIIEQNPQIKDLILNKTEEFKQLVPTHPQLQQVFVNVDIDKIKKRLTNG